MRALHIVRIHAGLRARQCYVSELGKYKALVLCVLINLLLSVLSNAQITLTARCFLSYARLRLCSCRAMTLEQIVSAKHAICIFCPTFMYTVPRFNDNLSNFLELTRN